jgi:hypothetical protein
LIHFPTRKNETSGQLRNIRRSIKGDSCGGDLSGGDGALWHPSPSDDTGDTIDDDEPVFHTRRFLLIAARKPSARRSLIAFAAWPSFAHAVVMSLVGFYIPSERTGFLIGSAVLVVIGVALLALTPPKQSVEQPSSASASRAL